MYLYSPSANLESVVPASSLRFDRSEAFEFTVHGIDFEIDPRGFGSRKAALEGALMRVQLMLAACTVEELQDWSVVDAVAATAVRRETRGWRCWQRSFRGARPALHIRLL
jgi:hypothetical protein